MAAAVYLHRRCRGFPRPSTRARATTSVSIEAPLKEIMEIFFDLTFREARSVIRRLAFYAFRIKRKRTYIVRVSGQKPS